MSHTAEIIAVGTELLLGNIVNTNAQEISQALSGVGVNVFWHTVVGDNPERLRQALEIARKRADIILTTGGLGPTYDDLTKQTICETFGKPLVLREDVLEGIRAYFARNVHLTMPENNRQQAEFPADCVIFDNPVGTAPGCAFEAEGTHVLMLPGPPFEMLTMLRDYAVPYLRSLSREVILSHDIMTFGMGESAIEELMREKGIDERIIHAAASHGWNLTVDIKPEHEMEKVLYAADELTGLIGACAIMLPSKSVQDLEVKSLKKKFKNKKFAAGCSRDVITSGAELLDWDLDTLFERTLAAMKASGNVD